MTLQKHAEELTAERFEKAEKRKLAVAELKSELYSPAERIRAWEKLHDLRLPLGSDHLVLAFVARSTGLTLAQIRDEQKIRSERAGAPVRAPNVYG